ncbi:MAG: alpha/beta hydrolase, partial [Planctomycetota bacterium]
MQSETHPAVPKDAHTSRAQIADASDDSAGRQGVESPADGPPRPRWKHPALMIPLRLLLLGAIVFALLSMTSLTERLVYFPSRGTPPPPPEFAADEVYFAADDGKRLHGWFIPAKLQPHTQDTGSSGSAAAARPGTVVMLHGNAGNISHHLAFVEFLPRAGFNLFIWDYRGYGNSERGKLRREFLMKDARAAIRAVRNRPEVDPAKIALYNHSLGNMFGTTLLAEDPELRGAVSVSPFASLPDAAASVVSPNDPPGRFARWVGRMLLGHGLDPIESITRLHPHQSVLLVHGEDDSVVPFSHGE